MYWPKLTTEQIKERVFAALKLNMNYGEAPILGVPATYLDREVFYEDAPFLSDAPFMSTMIANPNHIGCHTLSGTEKMFKGTQEIERDLIRLCAEQIFEGEPSAQDGYVASGGTEANIEAMWIYRNFFIEEYGAKPDQIAVIYSRDSHYSLAKGANLLNIRSLVIHTDDELRSLDLIDLTKKIDSSLASGVKYFIVVMNMSTTMFGSVDDIGAVTELLNSRHLSYKLHVDAAFGGFIYPFSNMGSEYSFKNKNITSFTIDGHKMLQTPYGTGIFLIRKNYMKYVRTKEAQYVPGTDHTLCGSRSGANAVSIWMTLHSYGSEAWKVKMFSLVDRTSDLCSELDRLNIRYFRNPFLNIVALDAEDVPAVLAEKYFLVADSYEQAPKWWKIVMMPHITRGVIDRFIGDLKAEKTKSKVLN